MPSRLMLVLALLSTTALAAPKKASKPVAKPAAATAPAPAPGPLCVKFELVDRVESLQEPAFRAADRLARQKLADAQARLLPDEEAEEVMAELAKAEKARGFMVRLSIARAKDGGLSAEALVTTFPARSLRGSWNVTASGGEIQELVEAIVPKVLEDALGDLGWATPAPPASEVTPPPQAPTAAATPPTPASTP
jgi:hypothetical protein